jgi:LacI family transcriptional regulator
MSRSSSVAAATGPLPARDAPTVEAGVGPRQPVDLRPHDAQHRDRADSAARERGVAKGTGRATIADVAERAGVDRAVVSKVLSDDPSLRVREATRERVIEAAAALRYRPNFHARGLARSQAGAIALLIPAGNPLMVPIIAGAEELASERGLLLWTAPHEGELTERYLRLLRSGAVDAALVAGLRAGYDADELFEDPRVPTVLVNRRSVGAERWVILDDEQAARRATEHLIAQGHRRIAWAGGPAGVDTAERRQNGFRDAMAAADLWLDPAWVFGAAYTPSGGAEAAAAILESEVRPTAIVAADANEGLGVWHTLHARGIRVPQDISLIAIHKLPAEDYRVPPMTCVEMPLHELGRRAAEVVLEMPWDAPIRETLASELAIFEGQTVAPPPGEALPRERRGARRGKVARDPVLRSTG